MRQYIALVYASVSAGISVAPMVGSLTICLIVLDAGSIALVGVTQRLLVDSVEVSRPGEMLIAVVLGATVYAGAALTRRLHSNLQANLSLKGELVLSRNLLSSVAGISTIDHLDNQEFLDRAASAQSGTYNLARASWYATETVAAILGVFLCIVLLASVHLNLTVLVISSIAPILLSRYSAHKTKKVYQSVIRLLRQEQRLHSLCLDPESGREIHVSGSGDELQRRAASTWHAIDDLENRANCQKFALEVVGWLLFVAGFVWATGSVSLLAIEGQATIGQVALVIAVTTRMRSHLAETAGSAAKVTQSLDIMRDYLWVLGYADRTQSPSAQPTKSSESGIQVSGLHFRYPNGGLPIFSQLDLRLPQGGIIGIVGPNGAGKTTLVNLLLGLYRPDAGSITISGDVLTERNRKALRARCSGVLQNFIKPRLTAGEAIGIGDVDYIDHHDRIRRAAAKAGAGRTIASLPSGLDTELGTGPNGINLSQGQWQQIALARGLMREQVNLFVFDEPTAALDPQTEHDIFTEFIKQTRQFNKASVVILVSHRFSNVHLADHIVVLGRHGISEQGSHAELMTRDGEYASLYDAQAQAYSMNE